MTLQRYYTYETPLSGLVLEGIKLSSIVYIKLDNE